MKKMTSNLVNLKYFFDTVKANSFGEAAKCNHVSQSAISQGIAKLENDLECQLFFRQPGICKVTEKGLQLFEGAKEIFHAIERVEDSVLQETGGTITFGCTHSFALGPLPSYLIRAKKAYPKLQINFRLGHYLEIKEWLKKGVIDFGILLDNDDLSLFECRIISQGYFRLFAAKNCKSIKDLGFLLDSDERREANLLKMNYTGKHGRPIPVTMEISSWEVIANLTESGLGIGQLPDYVAASRADKLKQVHKELQPIPYTLFALFKKQKTPNPYAVHFCNLLAAKGSS